MVVSHDCHFVSEFATRILAFSEKGIIDFHGNYNDYLKKFGADYLSQAWLAGR